MSVDVFESEQIDYQLGEAALICYQFNSLHAKHYFCSRCGVYPFHEMRSQPGKMRINLACIEGLDISALPVTVFDRRQLLP